MKNKNHTQKRESDFFRIIGLFIESRTMADSTANNYRVLAGALTRFAATKPGRRLTVRTFAANDIGCFIRFYRNEPQPDRLASKRRSHNTVCLMLKCLRTFFNWCHRQGHTPANPFTSFTGFPVERYASPYFLTTAERDLIAAHPLTGHPELAVQRDIFIFQCLTGCRVSDLLTLSRDNISDGHLEYIARKTAADNPTVIRMPLHPRALKIIRRYSCSESSPALFPFTAPQRYNYAIRRILTVCDITRKVSLLCPYTGVPMRRPINEVAASHIARRTFIGNLYRKVKDPALISSLTGHVEGSRAFNRYRTIDDDIKRELIMML